MDRRPGAPESRAGEASPKDAAGRPDAERGPEARADAALDRASRALSALDPEADGEIGTRLQEVRAALARGAAEGDPRAERLLARFDAMVFQPGRDGGAHLAELDRATHAARQLALLASAAVSGVDRPEAARQALLEALLSLAGAAAGSTAARAVEGALGGLLSELLGRPPGVQLRAHDAADVLRDLGSRLLGSLAERLEVDRQPAAAARLREALVPGGGRAAVEGALARVALLHRAPAGGGAANAAAYLDALLGGALRSPQDVAAALIAESGRSGGWLREVIGRHLAAREFEHAWNVARREFGDPPAFGFAVPDGAEQFATVQLVGDERAGGGGKGDRGRDSCHVTVGVDFSGLGPVRADLAVRDDQVALRLVVADPDVAREIRFRAAELESLLGLEGRRVLLAVADGTEEEARVDARRVGLKPEDHVMDLEG